MPKALCTICSTEFDISKKHICKIKDLKAQNLHLSDLYEKQFDTLCNAKKYICDNTWNINDRDKIKELLLIIWNSVENQRFEIKTKKDSDSQ